jgi:hypothetical protein
MSTHRLLVVLLLGVFGFFRTEPVHAGFGDFFRGVKDTVQGETELSQSQIVEGLKEALVVGTGNAVEKVSQVGGYLENPAIRIPLPDSIQRVESLVRAAGYGEQIDGFVMSMNRAAEQAAPEAKGIFWDAIKQMSIADAKKILEGRENEATLYFKEKTYGKLSDTFEPIVHDTMSQVGVTRKYQALQDKVKTVPFANVYAFDLDKYVNEEALEGLFFVLGEEEKKIRKDPAARVTDLLKKVFGNR